MKKEEILKLKSELIPNTHIHASVVEYNKLNSKVIIWSPTILESWEVDGIIKTLRKIKRNEIIQIPYVSITL